MNETNKSSIGCIHEIFYYYIDTSINPFGFLIFIFCFIVHLNNYIKIIIAPIKYRYNRKKNENISVNNEEKILL
jgi:hypothetical protein